MWVSVLAVCLLTAIKMFYRDAGSEALNFVLAPSCFVAAHVGGMTFVNEVGSGFISHAHHMVVGPACAGVNFLIVSLAVLYFSQATRMLGHARKLLWLLASVLGAYVATILTNGLRIVLAAQLYSHQFHAGWFTPERVHRALGVVIYCVVLLVLARSAAQVVGDARRPTAKAYLLPLCFYGGVALLVPVVNHPRILQSPRFLEHAAVVVILGLTVALLPLGVRHLLQQRWGVRLWQSRGS